MTVSLASKVILVALMIVGARIRAQQVSADESLDTSAEPETIWEYEPRVWTPDESSFANDADSDIWRDLETIQTELSEPPRNLQQQQQRDRNQLKHDERMRLSNIEDDLKQTRASLRNQSYFYEPKYGPRLRSAKVGANTTAASARRASLNRPVGLNRQQDGQQQEVKCDQFRVDIQETVICDRKRCEKLDFEWPKYENQMIVVQTTKHGMRFYQAHLAFKPPAGRRVKSGQASPAQPKMPIKFDLLDLFKPKPSPGPTTESTTSASASTTTTARPMASSTTRAPIRDQIPVDPAADNRTELVTTFRLDTRRRMQKILGFGGALSDSTCRNIKSLSPTMAKSLMEDYFGPRGLQYTLVRMTMGSSDFSHTPYTNNDKPYEGRPGGGGTSGEGSRRKSYDESDDVEMKYFHLTEEDFEYKLPVARQAIATSRRELKFFSSLWSPPIWMKNNSHIVHGYLKGDVYGPYYKALADLIVKWLEAYRRQGIEFWGTTGLNEPITGVKPFIYHNSLGISRDDFATWIKLYLGPMLRQRGFQNLKLMPIDDNKGYMPDWAASLLDDQEVAKYISGISLHWYMNDDYENLNFLVDKHPDKFLLSTEACNGYYPFQVHVLPGDWDRGMAYMLDITRLMHKNVVGWVDWNMALTTSGGPSWPGNYIDAAVLVNAERDEYYKSPAFYALGHYSRFVVPDSFRLDHRLANARYDHPLEAAGFYTPNEYVVIVALNANKHQVPFKVIVDRQLVRVVDLRPESFNTIVFKWKRPT